MSHDFSVGKFDSTKSVYFLNSTNESKKEVETLQPTNQTENDKKLSKSAKYMLGATAVATAVIGGLLLKRYTNPSSADFKFFKKIGGHFEKGKAFLKEKAYSGKLYSISKNGEMRIIEYKDGIMQSSQKINKGLLAKKDYFYHPNGKIKEVKSYLADSQGNINLDKQTTFTTNGSIKTTNAKGEVISEVKVKADERLAYDADKCITTQSKLYTKGKEYTYIKDGKVIIKEDISINDDYQRVCTNNLLTGEITNKKVYNNGSYDVSISGWVEKGCWDTGKVEHFDSNGTYMGYSEVTRKSEHFDGPDPFSNRGSGWRERYEYNKYDANNKLIDHDSHTETDWWEPYDMTYF